MNNRHWTVWMLLLALSITPAALAAGDDKSAKGEEAEEEKVEKGEADAAKDKTEELVKKMATLTLDHNVVPAKTLNIAWSGKTKTLRDIIEKLDEWGEEDEIGAVLLNITDMSLGFADMEELRDAVVRLKGQDKKIFAYLQGGPVGYLLATAADEICIAPAGDVALPGLGFALPFLKGHFQMRGLEYEVITAGNYKSSGQLDRREPTKFFWEEFTALIDSWFDSYVKCIAEGRNLDREKVLKIIDQALLDADEAMQNGLVDHKAYFEEYRDRVLRRERMKKYKDYETDWSQINSIQDLLNMMSREWQKEKERREAVGPKIAILHARGPIIDVSMGPAYASMLICRDDFIETVEEIHKNKSIKGVVLRIDSPGGSGYASDAIWQKLIELDEEKPLVVSMGRVAGSGGYYIAIPGRLIFAQPTTITGSIGVIATFQSAWSALNRADYNLYFMKRGARSLLGSGYRPLPQADHDFIQEFIDDFYEVFLGRVARCRKMPVEQIRDLAGGRIYSGNDALKIGLIDRVGGLHDAVEAVREMANIPPSAKIRLVHYPRVSSLGEIVAGLGGLNMSAPALQSESPLGTLVNVFRMAESPAEPVPFEKQLLLFSQTLRPLCWMPIPNLQEMTHLDIGPLGGTRPWNEPTPEQVKELLLAP